jgi:hypothetical protein
MAKGPFSRAKRYPARFPVADADTKVSPMEIS